MYKIIESLYFTPETYVTLYVNCAGVKIRNLITNNSNNMEYVCNIQIGKDSLNETQKAKTR